MPFTNRKKLFKARPAAKEPHPSPGSDELSHIHPDSTTNPRGSSLGGLFKEIQDASASGCSLGPSRMLKPAVSVTRFSERFFSRGDSDLFSAPDYVEAERQLFEKKIILERLVQHEELY